MKNEKGLIINPIQLSGNDQMAIDLMLLESVNADSEFTIAMRFYTWLGDWLSIGRNQKNLPKKWLELKKSKKLQIIRRPSGGNAVLHSGGLTYAIIWKSPPKKKKESYLEASKWLINGFAKAGIVLHSGNQNLRHPPGNCFATSTAADLIDQNGQKRIGSAQYWKNGHLLQHGEILIDPPKDLWKNVFNTLPPKPLAITTTKNKLQNLLKESLITTWPETIWEHKTISGQELKNITNPSLNYFSSDIFS